MNHRIKPPSNILSTYTRKHGHLRTLFVLIACLSMLTLNIRPDIVYADNQSTNTDEYPIPPEIESVKCNGNRTCDVGSFIFHSEKNSDEKCYPASVTKLMTALIVAENANLSDTLTVSANAVSSVKYGDANAGLKTGEEFSVEQALNMMLIKSANDIAYALGEHVGGSVANFANMMNKRAAELGCLNTHFTNASGLTDVNHYTTAYDMALICRAVLDYPVIMNAISYMKFRTSDEQDLRHTLLQTVAQHGNRKIPVRILYRRKNRLHGCRRTHPCHICTEGRNPSDMRHIQLNR